MEMRGYAMIKCKHLDQGLCKDLFLERMPLEWMMAVNCRGRESQVSKTNHLQQMEKLTSSVSTEEKHRLMSRRMRLLKIEILLN